MPTMENKTQRWFGIYYALFFVFGLFAVWFMPRLDRMIFPQSAGPGAITVLGIGIVFVLLTWMVFKTFASTNNLPKSFVIAGIIYSAFIILAKFVLGPLSFYVANQTSRFQSGFYDNPISLILIATGVFSLYFFVFFGIYKFYKKSVENSILKGQKAGWKWKYLVFIGLILLAGIIFLSGGSFVVLFLLLGPLMEIGYLGNIFSTWLGFLISLAVMGAILFVRVAFKDAAKQSAVVRNASIITSFFWLGTSLLFLYHALWVVYMITLVAVWPLKTFTSK
jgi:hypothetical protein